MSVRDVAVRAGVSLGTVSNVLNRPERVGEATRQRVLDAIDELGFVRNEAARQLRAGQSRTIGLIVLDIANPFFTDLAAGVEQRARESGLSVVMCNSGESAERESHYLGVLQEQRVYGVLIIPDGPRNPRIETIRRQGTAIVLVDRAGGRRQCSVSVDDVAGGRLAVAHLIERGHRRIAYVGGPATLAQVRDRHAGARQALVAAGLDEHGLTTVEARALTLTEGRDCGERLAALPRRRRPTAVFCANDLLALGLLQAMTRHGIAVPSDVAIVGYDDIDFAAAAAVPLTSVRQPRAELGRTATELLIEEVGNPVGHRHRQVVFGPELVVRDSTGRER